ncbi:MAG TPA: hypothetical protein ENH29_04105 [Bacteroidetes bacterium]|nr:hypothetical protein [Bacteroidota bacterium]
MKKTGLIFLFLFVYTSFLFAGDFPKIKGFKQAGEVRTYSADNLWEYIDGGADMFIDYGFRNLRSCDFSSGEITVAIDVYNMVTPLNAFGIYTSERPPEVEKLKYGVEAVLSPPYQALLLKDVYYVKIDVLEGDLNEKNGVQLLQAVAAALPGSDTYPVVLGNLPATGKIAGSERFVKKAYLGLAELNNCVIADYAAGKEKFRYFFVNTTSGEETEKLWSHLVKKWQMKKIAGRPLLLKKVPYLGSVALVKNGGKIFGVSGVEKEDELLKKAGNLIDTKTVK